jgi:hypothetical protein
VIAAAIRNFNILEDGENMNICTPSGEKVNVGCDIVPALLAIC